MYKSTDLKEIRIRIENLKARFRKNPAGWRGFRGEFRSNRDELNDLFFSAPTIESGAPFEIEKRDLLKFSREAADLVRQTTGEKITPSDLFRDD